MKQLRLGLWLTLLILTLSGCSAIRRAEQSVLIQTIALSAGEILGQTFTTSYAGLSGVAVYLIPFPDESSTGVLRLHLKTSPLAEDDLATAELSLVQVDHPDYYHFEFTTQSDQSQTDYFFYIELEGSGSIDLGGAAGETYLNGSLYANEQPVDGQLSFQLAYDPGSLLFGLLRDMIGWCAVLLGCSFLFVLPGWAMLAGILPDWPGMRWPEKLSLAGGVGLALYPVLFLWVRLAGFSLGAAWAWGPGLLAGIILLWQSWRGHHFRFTWDQPRLKLPPFESAFWPDLVFVMFVLVIFGARFWVIRGIAVPLWGDSYQHTVIAQRMIEAGGLFRSWEPYAPYQTLTVQYGFPALAALWAWLSGWDVVHSTLVVGQVANGMAVLALYPLALCLTRGNRWAGNFSLLVAGLLLVIPGVYVNWGRYAQLSGQAVLPVALVLLLSLGLRRGRVYFGEMMLTALVVAGMLLHYYRMAFYTMAFLPVLILLSLSLIREKSFVWPKRLLTLVLTAGLAVLLLLPWGFNVMDSALSGMVEKGIAGGTPVQALLGDFSAWLVVDRLISPVYLITAGLALLAALVLRRWGIAVLALWVALLATVRLGALIGLPGANMMQSFAVTIFLYAPVGLLLGWLMGEAAENALQHGGRFGLGVILFGAVLGLALGARAQKDIADPNTYAIVTRPDLRAMQWIRANTSPDAVFLVEGFSIYGGTTSVGSDGGWWLPLLTGRANTMPPQYALMNERPVDPGYSQAVVDLTNALEQRPWKRETLANQICPWRVSYVYIGQRQGLASTDRIQLFSPQDFDGWPLVYAADRVRIYAVPAGWCPAS